MDAVKYKWWKGNKLKPLHAMMSYAEIFQFKRMS